MVGIILLFTENNEQKSLDRMNQINLQNLCAVNPSLYEYKVHFIIHCVSKTIAKHFSLYGNPVL